MRNACGIRSKATLCACLTRSAYHRLVTTGGRTDKDRRSVNAEYFVRFPQAGVWFDTARGELTTYLEIFHWHYYEFGFEIWPGEAIFDVGANIGLFSIRYANSGSAGVFAFEPDPRAYKRLVRNLRVNQAEAVTPVNKAGSTVVGTGYLYLDAHTTSSSLCRAMEGAVPVDTVTIDAFVRAMT